MAGASRNGRAMGGTIIDNNIAILSLIRLDDENCGCTWMSLFAKQPVTASNLA